MKTNFAGCAPSHPRQGFTLLEILIAMAIGLVVVNAAFVCFSYARKAIVKTERLGVQSTEYQNMMQWVATNGDITTYPTGKHASALGRSDEPAYVANPYIDNLSRKVARLQIKDYSPGAASDPPPLYFVCLEKSAILP